MKYLVTGGYGFIGSHVVDEIIKDNTAQVIIVDNLSTGSNIQNIKPQARIQHVMLSINDRDLCRSIPHVDYIVHLAAESHVDRSLVDPLSFAETAVVGTTNILEIAKRDNARMVHVSTDEVYGHLSEDDSPFLEDSMLNPRSPYSASKAGSDLMCLAYKQTFGVNVTVTRCCNNYGPRQHSEKLIPTIVRSIVFNQKIPVYGNGRNIREWIHVADHAKAILETLHTRLVDVINISGSASLRNLEIIKEIIKVIENDYPQFARETFDDYIQFVEDRKGHDFRYAVASDYYLNSVMTQRPFSIKETVDTYIKYYA